MRRVVFAESEERQVARRDASGPQFNRHLLSAAASGTEQIAADLVRLPAGLIHNRHRHPHADQVMLILAGELVARGDGEDLRVGPESAVVFGRGEWHEVQVLGAEVRAINIFCGVGSADAAGYEEGST